MPLLPMEASVAWTGSGRMQPFQNYAQTHVSWTLVRSVTDTVLLQCQRPWLKQCAASTDVAWAAPACNQRDVVQTSLCNFTFCWPCILLQSLLTTNLTHNYFYYTCLFQFPTCFKQPSAHHQESQLYQYDLRYMSLWKQLNGRKLQKVYLKMSGITYRWW
jgi:hypothetical protein